MAKIVRIYWDSCAWIGLLNGEHSKMRELEIVYNNAKSGNCELWTSTVAYAEVCKLEVENGKAKPLPTENSAKIAAIFQQTFVKPIPLDAIIANNARHLRRTISGLGKFQDAIHLASAQWWDVPIFHTYDNDDLLPLSETLQCRNGTKLKICYPDETTDGPLFANAKKA